MKHFTSLKFQRCYKTLPKPIQEIASRNFVFLKNNPRHLSLHFKKVGKYYSLRIGLNYRALAVEIPEGLLWFWIGNHSEYDNMLRK